jgi:vacuolar-type H+-ATPase subunit F/Vma7
MKKIAFITTEDADYGFRLAGAFQFIAGKEKVADLVEELIERQEFGIILIDERILDDELLSKIDELQQNFEGIVSTLASPYKEGEMAYDIVDRLVSRAIGYQVRFKNER